jgi:hypothetical protein
MWRLCALRKCLQLPLVFQRRTLLPAACLLRCLQLPELLSPRGHAFIVAVPENKPQGEVAQCFGMFRTFLNLRADSRCVSTSMQTLPVCCVLRPAEILSVLAQAGLQGKVSSFLGC